MRSVRPTTIGRSALLVCAVLLVAGSPASQAKVVSHPTGFSAQAPADFEVGFERESGSYVIGSDRRRAAVRYRRVLDGQRTVTIARIERSRRSASNRRVLRRILRTARGGYVSHRARSKRQPAGAVTLAWNAPTDGGVVSGRKTQLEISASSTSSIRRIDLRVDEMVVARELYTPYRVTFDGRQFADGPHRLTAVATLSSGKTTSTAIDVTIRNGTVTPPAPPTDPTPPPAKPKPPAKPEPAVPSPTEPDHPAPTPPFPAPGTGALFSSTFEAGSFAGWYIQSLRERATITPNGAFGSTHAARFEVRDGDVEPDTGSERSEVSGPTFDEGQDLYFRDSFRVPSGSSIGSSWQIINQLHETNWGGSPGIAVFLKAGPSIKIGAGDGSPSFLPDVRIQYDRWHDLVYRANLSRNPAAGFMEVWLDGVRMTLSNGHTRMYGQTIQAVQGYLKAGIYRGSAHTGTSVIEHDNLIVGTSLTAVSGG